MMAPMNPFDAPPSGNPVSLDSPAPTPDRRGRGRMALVAVLTAGLIGGGIAGISQLASADRPDLASTAPDEPTDETVPPADDSSDDSDTAPPTDAPEPPDGTDGEIVLDTGDGDPIVIDLGEFDEADIERLTECIGLPMFDFGEFDPGEWAPGELPNLDEFFEDLPFDMKALEDLEGQWVGELGGAFGADGGSVTVAGPDGVSVVDLGENGSVTVTRENGEITVETSGDATVSELTDLFGDFGAVFEGAFDDQAFDEFLESLPALDELPSIGELPDFEPIDADAVRACIDEVTGN